MNTFRLVKHVLIPLLACAIPLGIFSVSDAAASANQEGSVAPSDSAKRYDGRTLSEWRQVIKDLSPTSPVSRSAVPGLMLIASDQNAPWITRRQAASTLGRLGKLAPEAVPALIRILDEPRTKEHSPRIWATKALSLFGPFAREATPRLVAILKSSDNPIAERQVALDALGQIGGAHPRAIPALVETLTMQAPSAPTSAREEIQSLRELAAESIAVVGQDAAIAVPVLLRSMHDPSESMRRKSIAALGKMGSAAELAIPALIETLAFDESPAVRDVAQTTLAEIGKAAIPAVSHILGDADTELRLRAVRTLGQMKTVALPATTEVKKTLEDQNPQVRFAAAKSLWQISGQAKDSLQVFVETLTSPERQLRMQAFRLLTVDLGKQAIPARPAIGKLLKHPQADVRQIATKSLERIPSPMSK